MYKITIEFPFIGTDVPKDEFVDVYYTMQREGNLKVLYIDRVMHRDRTVHLTAMQEMDLAMHIEEHYPV